MKKKILVILGILLCTVSIVLMFLFAIIPQYYENRYIKEKNSANLYNLCDYIYTFDNSNLILKYYPLFIFETEFNEYSWEYEKDNMLTKLLQTSLNCADFDVFAEYLSKSYNTYSSKKFAEVNIIEFINGYYAQYDNLENTYNLYEVIIDTCPDVVGKFTFCQEYVQFVNSYTDDVEKFEEVNNKKKDLAEKVKEHWERNEK